MSHIANYFLFFFNKNFFYSVFKFNNFIRYLKICLKNDQFSTEMFLTKYSSSHNYTHSVHEWNKKKCFFLSCTKNKNKLFLFVYLSCLKITVFEFHINSSIIDFFVLFRYPQNSLEIVCMRTKMYKQSRKQMFWLGGAKNI